MSDFFEAHGKLTEATNRFHEAVERVRSVMAENSACRYCRKQVFEPCRSIEQAYKACVLGMEAENNERNE